MFYRGQELSTRNGLWLFMLKRGLDKINARVEVVSEEGKFSVFIVHFLSTPANSVALFASTRFSSDRCTIFAMSLEFDVLRVFQPSGFFSIFDYQNQL